MKIGCIGLGKMGRWHLEKLLSLGQSPLVFDENLSAKENLPTNVSWCTKLEDLIENCESVVIATPATTHSSILKQCLESNLNIFVEKPLLTKPLEWRDLKTQMRSEHLLLVGMNERLNEVSIRLKEIVDKMSENWDHLEFERVCGFNKRIGDVGVVEDMLIHDLDLLCFLFPNETWEIEYVSHKRLYSHFVDSIDVFMKSEKRSVKFKCSRLALKADRKIILKKSGRVLCANLGTGKIESAHNGKIVLEESVSPGDSLYKEQELFLSLIREKKSGIFPVNIEQSMSLMFKVLDEIHEQ